MRPAGDRARDPGPSGAAIASGSMDMHAATLEAPGALPLTLQAARWRRLAQLRRIAAGADAPRSIAARPISELLWRQLAETGA